MTIDRSFRNSVALAVFALASAVCLPSVQAQGTLYENLTTAAIDTRNNSTAWLGTGANYVQQQDPNNANSPLISGMMADDIFTVRPLDAISFTITSMTVAIANGAVDNRFAANAADRIPIAMNGITVYIRIYEDDNPSTITPNNSQDGPGTLVGQYTVGTFNLAAPTIDNDPLPPSGDPGAVIRHAASIQNVTIDLTSASNTPLTLPYDSKGAAKYWYGVFFEQARDTSISLALQRERLGQVGLAFYTDAPLAGPGPTTGSSADVFYESRLFSTNPAQQDALITKYQRNRFNQSFDPNDPNGAYDQFRAFTNQNINSNFGWRINGTFGLIPEPGAGAFLLLAVPGLVAIARRRK